MWVSRREIDRLRALAEGLQSRVIELEGFRVSAQLQIDALRATEGLRETATADALDRIGKMSKRISQRITDDEKRQTNGTSLLGFKRGR